MQHSPLVRTLQLLTPTEMDTLHLFVQSPIFNTVRPEETRLLFEYLRARYPGFQHPDLDRELAGKHFFPKAKDPVAALFRTMTQLSNILRKFIGFQHWATEGNGNAGQDIAALLHDTRQRLALMRFYSERLQGQPQDAPEPANGKKRRGRKTENFVGNLYQQTLKDLDAQQRFHDFEDHAFTDFHHYRFLLELEKYHYDSQVENPYGDQNLLSSMEQLDASYLLQKMDLMCKLIHHQQLTNIYTPGMEAYERLQINWALTRQLALWMLDNAYPQNPAIQFYALMLNYLGQNDPVESERLCDQLLHMMTENPHMLPASRMRDCKIIIRSFWPNRYRETKDRRFLELLYRVQLEQLRQLGPQGGLPATQCLNTLLTALKLGRQHWAAMFLNEFQQRIIATEHTEILLGIMQAALLFHQKNYKKAADTIPHYLHYGELDNIYLYAIAATLDARIRFELDDFDSDHTENMLRATATHIRRDETMPPHRRDERLRFFGHIGLLEKIRQKRRRKENTTPDLAKLRKRLDTEIVVDWEWLEEKYADFID
jgi:hypothetical protein